jgi:hypothetical protein
LPAQSNTLVGITCLSATECWAVGSYAAAGAEQTLIQAWNGESWSIVESPSTDPTEQNFLNGVTCRSANDCWAVGIHTTSVNQTLTLHWDGSAWSIIDSPTTDPAQANVLFSVGCISETECWAVGYHKEGNPLRTLLLRWDGASWSITASPNSAPGQTNTFRSVTCDPSEGCWAVGNYYNAQSISRTFVTRYAQQQTTPLETVIDLELQTLRNEVVATARLTTTEGARLPDREIVFFLNGQETARSTTASDGTVSLTFPRNDIKPHDVVQARFLGDEGLAPSQASASLRT